MAYTVASGECYIDLTDGNDSTGEGTEALPWKTFQNITSEEYVYVKRGSSGNVGAAYKSLLSIQGMNVLPYGTGDAPVISSYTETTSGNWIEVDGTDGDTPVGAGVSNIWRYDIGTYSNQSNPVALCNFGSLGVYGPRIYQWTRTTEYEQPAVGLSGVDSISEKYDWTWLIYAYTGGFGTQSNYLYVYSEGNPHTYYGGPIYYQGQTYYSVFHLRDCPDFNISGLKFQYCGHVITTFNNAGESSYFDGLRVHDNECDNIYGFCKLLFATGNNRWLRDFEIYNNTATNVYGPFIFSTQYLRDGRIYNNNVKDVGVCISTGGIYFTNVTAPAGEEILVYNNTIDNMDYGIWWTADGAAIYADSGTGGVWVNRNLVKNSHKAMHCNSGLANNKFIGNVAENCDILFQQSDSASGDAADTECYYNTGINLGRQKYWNETKGCIDINSSFDVGSITVKNNIIVIGNNTNCPYGFINAGDATFTEDYNAVYGYTTAAVDGSLTPISLGSNDVTEDPRVSNYYSVFREGPVVGVAGTVTIDEWFTDFYGYPLADDIGAVQVQDRASTASSLIRKRKR